MKYPRIINIEALPNSKLKITYATDEVKIFDVSPYICGSWFGELSNAEYFATVHIVNNGMGIEWENGQDIAPHELYECSISA